MPVGDRGATRGCVDVLQVSDVPTYVVIEAPYSHESRVYLTYCSRTNARRSQHWDAAGEDEHAITAWREAGHSAAARQAFAEAQYAFGRALTLLSRADESAERTEQELQLQTAFARTLQITQGYSAPSTMATTARAHLLADRAGDLVGRLQNTLTTWVGISSAGDYETGLRLADQLLMLAQGASGGEWLGAAHMAQVTTRYRIGDLAGAEAAFVNGRPHFAELAFQALPGAFAQTYGNAAIIAWLLGEDEEARRRIELVLDHSRERNPYEVAFGSFMAATLWLLLESPEDALRLAKRSIVVADDNFPQFSAGGRIVLGRALAQLGRPSEGAAELTDGLSRMGRTQSRSGLTMYLTWLGEARLAAGWDEAASATVEDALSVNSWERFYRPETLRLRAELLARHGEREKADQALAESLIAAKAMGARVFLKRMEVRVLAA